jgi:YVTN family beta-propeller protein
MPSEHLSGRYRRTMAALAWAVGLCALVGLAAWVWSAALPTDGVQTSEPPTQFASFGPLLEGERLLHWTVGKHAVSLEKRREFDVPTGPEALVTLPDGCILITCRAAQVVAILDPERGRLVQQIPVEGQPLACCLTRDGTRAWVTLEDRRRVAVLDLETMKRVAESETGDGPEAIATDIEGRVVAIANWVSQDLTLIDGPRAEPLGLVPLPANPRGAVVHPSKPFATVALTGSDRLLKVNWEKRRVEDELVVGRGPRHLVQTSDGDTLFVALNDPPTVAKVDRLGGRVRSTCFLTKGRAGTILLGPNERDLFVANSAGSAVTVVDTATMSETATVDTDLSPDGLALSADGRRLYVAHRTTSAVYEFAVTYDWPPTP